MIPLHLPFDLPLVLLIIINLVAIVWGCIDLVRISMPPIYKLCASIMIIFTGVIGVIIYLFFIRYKFVK